MQPFVFSYYPAVSAAHWRHPSLMSVYLHWRCVSLEGLPWTRNTTKHTPYLHSKENEKNFWHVDDVGAKRQSVMVSHAQTVETKESSVMVKTVVIQVELLTDGASYIW